MSTIANLAIGLSANSAKLKKDLDKAKKHTSKWGKGAAKDVNLLGTAIKKLGPAIAAVGFASLARSVVETSKQLGIMSNLTGSSTTRLQQITPSLERAGISLEKYSDIIKDVNDKTHDFLQTGGGPMADFFENIAPKVGVTKEAFKDLSGEQGLQLYINSLEKAGLTTEEMTFYMEALASDSTMLLPLLKNNAEGMDEFALSAGLAIKPELLKSITELGANLKLIGTILLNITVNILGPFILGLMKLTKLLVASADAISDWFTKGDMGRSVQSALETSIDNTSLAIVDQINASRLLEAALKDGTIYSLAQAEAELIKAEARRTDIKAMESQRREMALSSKEYQQILRDLRIADDVIKSSKVGSEAYEFAEQHKIRMIQKQREFLDLLGETTTLTKEEAAQLAVVETNIAALKERVSEWNGENNETLVLTDRIADAVGSISFANPLAGAAALSTELGISLHKAMQLMGLLGASNQSQITGDPLDPRNSAYNSPANRAARARAMMDSGELYKGSSNGSGAKSGGGGKSAAEKAAEEAARISGIGDSFLDGVADSFASALKTGDWKGFLEDTLDSFTSDVISNFAEGLFSPLKDFLSDAIGALMTSLNGSDGGKGIWGSLGTIFSFFGAADGGIVPTTPFSKSYADSVPTMLQPGELVVPKDQVGNFMGSGGGQTFNINVTGDVSRATRKEIVAMMPQIANGTNALNKERGIR